MRLISFGNVLLKKQLPESIVWWLAMLLLCIAPFLSDWRIGPISGFYLETASLYFALCLTLMTVLTQTRSIVLPKACVYWLMLVVLLVFQARLMSLPYAEQSDLTAIILLIMALLAYVCRIWVQRIGQINAVRILAWALLIGALLQGVVCVLQFIGFSSPFISAPPSPHYVYGQLGQRNHLGHYLMWGVLALCYLWHERQLPQWLAMLLLVCLTAVLGLLGSRTILLYVTAIGVSMAFWRWRGGREVNRQIAIVAVALALVLLFQFILSPLVEWLFHIDYQSGAERMEQGGFTQSGRAFEWKKAWHIFLSAPWFGYGWGSYAYQGFLDTSVYAKEFRLYENGVLFTHSHNLILNLLAEMGLVGTILIVGGFVWVVCGFFRQPVCAASMMMMSILLVTLCHSLLEYPLWYVYFLAVFVVVMSLSPLSEKEKNKAAKPYPKMLRYSLVVLSILLIAGISKTLLDYGDLLEMRIKTGAQFTQQEAEKMRKQSYFLRYYTDMSIVNSVNNMQTALPLWAAEPVALAAHYRPFNNTYIHGLYLAQTGEIAQAKDWAKQMAHYYPGKIPGFLIKTAAVKNVAANSNDETLSQTLRIECYRYQSLSTAALNCTAGGKESKK
ncbi:PglL family O-oligosaccharyltransferase [Stenoxybacter acetivorans]|uniref:PglL family O-oligosaccharyltransferase n=1 Tax=Stenoxybacter acetivorans TaxID=422441 RepID=UPI000689987E|nr:Wzy polymerase domain-containing protein [Stenoxybacter acetivorans]